MRDTEVQVREADPREVKVRAWIASVAALITIVSLISIVAVAYLALQAGQQSERNGLKISRVEEIVTKLGAVNDRLIDCTEPGGDCFHASQKRTGEAVLDVNQTTFDVIVAAISCQEDGITEKRELARCTARRASNK